MAPTIGYWKIRGLGEPIWYLLEYSGASYEEKRYSYNDRKVWMNDKFFLGLDFPNLPYLLDGDVKLTQSNTILRYLARKHGLQGRTDAEQLRVELAEQQILDFRLGLMLACLKNELDGLQKGYGLTVPEVIKPWEQFLGDRKFLAGDYITYVDFIAYDAFDFHRMIFPGCLDAFPTIKAYVERIESLPAIKKYLQSDRYTCWPIFVPIVKFGGDPNVKAPGLYIM